MILFTGRGSSGSWKIRGDQLGEACGAIVKPMATIHDMRRADMIVLVKRSSPDILNALRASGKPWVLDALDLYPQPKCSMWNREQAIEWVKSQITLLAPHGVIWPNQRMADDCDTGIPGTVLYHHYRPHTDVNPIREKVYVVGYEGSPNYIGEWLEPIREACRERGWHFVINPVSLAEVDIVIACRGREFNGYAQKHWKSNVKLANAHGTGTPFIGPRECGYLETATTMEEWADCFDDLPDCLDRLSEQYHRQRVQKEFIAKRYSVTDAAKDLTTFLATL